VTLWPTYLDLLEAYHRCRHGKQPSSHQLYFEKTLGENLLSLHREIHTRKYRPSRTVCFIVTHPKPREVFAAHFRDRIIHHLIVEQLEPRWEKKLIYSSFACRKGKGPDRARDYLCTQVNRLSHGGRKEVFALQMDITSFFATLFRPILLDLILSRINNPMLRWLVEITYCHDPRKQVWFQCSQKERDLIPPDKSWFNQSEDQGLPIGNLTSQFGSNVYLNALDHFALRGLRAGSYLRYMDDLTFLDPSVEKLQSLIQPLQEWLEKNRKQRFHPGKTQLTSMNHGIDYLGYQIRQNPLSGQVAFFAPAKKKWEFIQAIRSFEKSGILDPKAPHPLGFPVWDKAAQNTLAKLNSRLGFLRQAKSYLFRKETLSHLEGHFANPEKMPSEFYDRWGPLHLRSQYRSIRLK